MGFAAICSFLRPALGLLLAWGIAGCASAPPPLALQQQGIKRIAVARPAFADHSLILGARVAAQRAGAALGKSMGARIR